ncbi:MAG: hypothetical protein R3338_00815 [Thermoanaerobaculia bacterium]|nr:hypothetical protein [Thermoanaerobaculia bacterium]
MRTRNMIFAALSIIVIGLPIFASNFRAADIIYLPAAGRLQGQAFFKTDVVVTNVSPAAVEVDAVLLSTGGGDARAGLDNPVRIGTLQAGESMLIEDVIQAAFNQDSGFGQMIFFSCRAGGDCTDCTTGDCLPIVVEGRVYAESTEPAKCGEGELPTCTEGQLFSGYPWYSYISSSVADRSLDEAWITGIQENTQYRSNLGFANASEFSTTTLNVRLFNNDGTQFGSTANVTLGPLGHTQQNVSSLFPGFTGEGYVRVSQPATGVAPTNPDHEDTFIASGAPGFFAYGSVLDNATDDPTTLEAVYPVEFDFLAVYGKAGLTGRSVSRPE